ncbi:MAG: RidA family protein [Microbacteriaceae bacterium]|nr:RidA family protein [Microbacteriaceae bacterium]
MIPGPLHVPGARPPGPPYSPAFVAPPFVFVSGCVPMDLFTGESVAGGVEQQAERVLGNVALILEQAGLSLADVIKTTVYLTDIGLSEGMNTAYRAAFGDHRPARATVQIGPLSRPEFLLEIDAIAWKKEM